MERPFPNTIVCQLGARRHYAVPVALHQAGLLERLYTDFCMSDPLLRGLRRVTPSRLARGRLSQLFTREVHEIPAEKVECLWRSTLGNSWSALTSRKQQADAYARYCRRNTSFGNAVVRHGFGSADAVYGFNGAAVEVFEAARSQGRLRFLDQTIAPLKSMAALLEDERQRWPNWDLQPAKRTESVARMIDREQAEWELADVIICGSEFVADSLTDEGVSSEKLKIVRWGNHLDSHEYHRESPSNRPLHVLIAGTLELRKGIPYVVEAARHLPKEQFEFRAVGPIRFTPDATSRLQEHVELLGAVPRSEMPTHYEWADVLLHPSLAEGSANVCYEALAAGLPVITTANSGSTLIDGVQGFVVPVRDAESIARRLMQLASDSELWLELSRQARESVGHINSMSYSSQLASALSGASRSNRDSLTRPLVHNAADG